MTLTFTAPGSGAEQTITISDSTTPTEDYPTGVNAARPLTFTVYVVTPAHILSSPATALAANTDSVYYAYKDTEHRVDSAFAFSPEHAPVYYSVQGSGSLYVGSSNPKLRLPNGALTSSSAPVYLRGHTATSRVTASVAGTTPHTVIYIYIDPSNVARYPRLEITNGNPQTGAEGGRLEQYLEVKVTDGRGSPVSGVAVEFATSASGAMFIPVPGTMVYVDGRALADSVSDPVNGGVYVATSTDPAKKGTPVFVQTDRGGLAKVYYEMGTDATQTITASLEGIDSPFLSKNFTARVGTTGSERVANLEIVSGNPQSAAKGKDLDKPLVVIARSTAGYRIPNVVIQFRASIGILSREGLTAAPDVDSNNDLEWGEIPTGTPNPPTGQQIYVITGSDGQASVTYNVGQFVIAREVTTEIRHEPLDSDYSFAIDRVVFNVNGRGGTSQPSQPSQPAAAARTITIVPSSIDGEPGEEIEFTVISSPAAVVVLDSGDLDDGDFSPLFGSGTFTVDLTLPDEEDEYDFSATSPGYPTTEVTVTVESEEVALGRLSIVASGDPSNGQQTIRITVRDSNGALAVGAVNVTLTGTGINRTVPTASGAGAAVIAVPNTVTVSADGYSPSTPLTLTGTGQQEAADDEEDDEADEEETPTAAEPDSIEITGPSARSGTVNEELEAALIVRVLDDDGDGLEDARVFYRVIEGRGRISDGSRGGRRIGVVTDDDGYARVNFTPTDGGTHTIRVNTDDLSTTVEFTITTGSGSGARDAGTGGTSGASISPVVHVAAASRPPMLWVDGGAIYALVDADVKEFAPSVDNALNITVGGGKVYWTEKTGENSGTINSADLDGSDVTELVSVRSVPMGIAVDTAGRKLYWTASSGKIKRANLNGSGRENVVPGGLDTPMDLALADGNVYWTQGNGSVRFASLTGQIRSRPISTGSDTPGSLAISGGKVYWTEKTAASAGTINSANLNGTDVRELTSIRSVPMGIAVDTARSKLYWTASSGKVKQANLNGSGAKNVVSGLGSPGELVLSNSIAAPAGAGSSAGSGKTASGSKYDVNGDGTVDIGDSDALTIALAANSTDPKYDVDGNGKVDIFDLIEVRAKYSPGAAGAPTLFGMKLSAVQIDRLQEQIDLLIATNDRSPAAMRTLVYLQQLLVTARPEKTQLLANYPNPFNPETWIPYELATDTNVRLTIYNTQGVVIRSLQFGHQSAGYYTGRDRAAYWDGRNALGEQVASGLYFYQLETDEMSLMRKMVILK